MPAIGICIGVFIGIDIFIIGIFIAEFMEFLSFGEC